jgi:hypothetical protein
MDPVPARNTPNINTNPVLKYLHDHNACKKTSPCSGDGTQQGATHEFTPIG